MTVEIVNRTWACVDDAAFRVSGKGFGDSLANLGFVKVYSGIDWTTVLRPAATGSYNPSMAADSEVWKSNDGKADFFIKLQFGASSGHPYGEPGNRRAFRMLIQVATVHVGNGVLGGRVSPLRDFGPMSPYPSDDGSAGYQQGPSMNGINAGAQNLFSGNSGRVTMQYGGNSPVIGEYFPAGQEAGEVINYLNNNGKGVYTSHYAAGFLSIERTKNDDGTDNEDGIIFLASGPFRTDQYNFSGYNGSSFIMTVIPFNEEFEITSQLTTNVSSNTGRATTISGNEKTVFPFQPTIGARVINPPIGFIGSMDIDFIVGLNSNIKIYNQTKTYRKSAAYHRPVGGLSWISSRLLQIWE